MGKSSRSMRKQGSSFGLDRSAKTMVIGDKQFPLRLYMRAEWYLRAWEMVISICAGAWSLSMLKMVRKCGTFSRSRTRVNQAVKLGPRPMIPGDSVAVESGKKVLWTPISEWFTSRLETLFPRREEMLEKAIIFSPAPW